MSVLAWLEEFIEAHRVRARWYAGKAIRAVLAAGWLAALLIGSWHLWGWFIGLHVEGCG